MTARNVLTGNGEISRSEQLYDRALQVMPGGCSRNTVLRKPHPFYVDHGSGCYVTDIEGSKRIDFANNMASLIHGHAHPEIVSAVTEQLRRGTAFTMATEQEVLYAEDMVSRVANFENIRFVNSGTEAVMSCLKAARAYTGRPKIAKVEGAYHGLYDFAEVSQTSNPDNWGRADRPASTPVAHGTPRSTLNDVVVIPFNDAAQSIEILEQHADSLACVLLDLVPHRIGLIQAQEEYVQALRQWTRRNGILLVCDEVITFRCGFEGAQQSLAAEPDLTAMGKMIGGGFPVGAIAGSREVMSVMDPLKKPVLFPHSGTFSANPITMTAGRTAMRLFDRNAVAELNALGKKVRSQLAEAISLAGVSACVTGSGSMFRILMKPEPPTDYRSAYADDDEVAALQEFLDYVTANGILLIGTGTGMLSTAMGQAEIDRLCEVSLAGFRHLKDNGGL
jgi:glutamate-1-semialdehyde 2,1-aminomutase